DRLHTYGDAGRAAAFPEGLAEYRVAQQEFPWLRRLHADRRVRRRARRTHATGPRGTHRDHVRRGGAVALPSLAGRRRTARARGAGGRDHVGDQLAPAYADLVRAGRRHAADLSAGGPGGGGPILIRRRGPTCARSCRSIRGSRSRVWWWWFRGAVRRSPGPARRW